MTADLPALPIARAVLRESRFIDIEVRGDALSELDAWRLEAGDVVEFSAGLAPLEPEGAAVLVLHEPVRKGAVLTLCVEGAGGQEGRVLSKRLLQGHCYTILRTQPKGEFTVHRHISVEGTDQLKLHFAHGGQLQKLQFREGASVSVKEKPCGLADFDIAECHTEDLEKCPNCRTGLKGPRQKDFNAADLCKPGTQYALVRPKERPRRGLALFAEKELLPDATLHFVMRSADRPEAARERSPPSRGRRGRPRLRSRSRARCAPRLRSRSRGRESAGRARRPSRRARSRSRRGRSTRGRSTRSRGRSTRSRPRFGAVPPPDALSSLRRVPAPRPPGETRSPTRESKDPRTEASEPGEHPDRDWETLQDEEGNTFFHHIPSGHTQWEPPGGHGERSTGDWEACEDEQGNVFYHHVPSGDTQWEPPSNWSRMPDSGWQRDAGDVDDHALDILRKRAAGLGIRV